MARRVAVGPIVVAATVVATMALGAGCIIPDANIGVVEEFDNPGAVRIVVPTPITAEADDACNEVQDFNFCPALPETVRGGELVGNGPLCRCANAAESDDNAPNGFEIYVEDPDVEEDDVDGQLRPTDDLFGALLLDVPPGATDLSPYQAYTNALPPDQAARRAATDVRAIDRDGPFLRVFPVGGFTGGVFDVCNDNDGQAVEQAGLHELRFIVTDRPWFAPIIPGAEDDEGNPVRGDPLIGVPDLPSGATYDTTTFVFRCLDASEPEGASCGCFNPEDPN